ncbi:MAG: 2-amino-4-hydroxy-6-hydroxymethyldihydropteridine diphosphokinase [Bdellovibrio sp.]|nr:2-amino-4-hydroxy-6-hydroxymethyldihydropteridine diphosphokinase [Bdellovibrio sp.]
MKAMMLALGTNLGDKVGHLRKAIANIGRQFVIKEISRVYRSNPIGYLQQPDFYNLVMLCDPPPYSPLKCLSILQEIEIEMGRIRSIPQGPRIIDIDMLFFGMMKIQTLALTLPHPQWQLRAFTLYPLMELVVYDKIKMNYTIQTLPDRKGLLPVGFI